MNYSNVIVLLRYKKNYTPPPSHPAGFEPMTPGFPAMKLKSADSGHIWHQTKTKINDAQLDNHGNILDMFPFNLPVVSEEMQ